MNCTKGHAEKKGEAPARECGGLMLQKGEGEWYASVEKQFSEI
jgi:hypothetical protein